MPIQGKRCENFTCGFDDTEAFSLIIGCKKRHKADGECIKGKPDCPVYKAGLLYSTKEIKKLYRIKR